MNGPGKHSRRVRRKGRHCGGDDRAQSELLGTILIFGLSLLVIGTTLAFGAVAIGDLTDEAEATNVENSLSHFSSKVSLVALGDSDVQSYSLSSTRDGTVSVQPDAGEIEVTHTVNGTVEGSTQSPLGAVVYQGANRDVAYQGGGVWTKRGENSSMVSPPEYYYRGATLTLPIIRVDGEGAVSGTAQGDITPGPDGSTRATELGSPLDEGTVTVRVQSEYYEGWFDFFTQRAEGSTVIYPENNTVISELTVPDDVPFNKAISVRGDYSASGNAGAEEGEVEEGVPHRSAGPLIDSRIADASSNNDNTECLSTTLNCDEPLTAGTYFIDGDTELSGDLEFDTSDGNINFVVDGDFDIGNHDVTVTDTETDNRVNYYINGSLNAQGDTTVSTATPEPEPPRNVFFVGDQLLDNSQGATIKLEALIYAPDADFDTNGNAEIIGSLIANSVEIGGTIEVSRENVPPGTSIEITGAANQIQFIHVTHNEVSVTLGA